MMETWQSVLAQILPALTQILKDDPPPLALIGSTAAALQGCRITPRDIDILARNADAATISARHMQAFTPPECPVSTDDEDWYSSLENPISKGPDEIGFFWYFGRWFVDGMRVEIAHIIPPEGFLSRNPYSGIWEAGPEIWAQVKQAPFQEDQVSVVPLEIQLETNYQREMVRRIDEIARVFLERGFDARLLEEALKEEHFKKFSDLMAHKLMS